MTRDDKGWLGTMRDNEGGLGTGLGMLGCD